MTETIKFKSTPDLWSKEEKGLKPNTFRKIDTDERFKILFKFHDKELKKLNIIIENSFNSETFERQVKDVTFWDKFVIISWRD